MPVLESIKKTKKISLPSYEGSEVVLYTDIFFEDVLKFDNIASPTTKELLEFLPQMIKEWNFTDKDKVPLEITAESIGKLKLPDVNFLLSEVIKVLAEVKKNSEEAQGQPSQ